MTDHVVAIVRCPNCAAHLSPPVDGELQAEVERLREDARTEVLAVLRRIAASDAHGPYTLAEAIRDVENDDHYAYWLGRVGDRDEQPTGDASGEQA